MSSPQPDRDSIVASVRRHLAVVKQVLTILVALATLAKMVGVV